MNAFLQASTRIFIVLVWPLLTCLYAGQPLAAQSLAAAPDSITVAIAPAYDSVNGFHRFWLGCGYRDVWAAPLPLPVLQMRTEKGGLTPLSIGGGLQTRSLRLQDVSGRQWVLRSVQKYPGRGLPPALRNTIAQRILQDQVVTVHPFGALAVPPLAAALEVAHTNPRILYVPDDPALGPFRSEFANTVMLLEEKGAMDTFRTISTEAAQAELEKGSAVRVNQKRVLRARLLDFLLGDWDRHEGQWRWEARRSGSKTELTPVPVDRDYVFYNTSGVLPWLVSRQYLNARFQGFDEHIRNVAIYNYNNRFFDRYFLNALAENDWKEILDWVQQRLTDEVIRKAIRQMPDTVYALTGAHLEQTLLARRQNLRQDALRYYRFLAVTVDVPGTAEDDVFRIRHAADGHVKVAIYAKEEDEKTPYYRRDFDPAVTREIRLYGLSGRDAFYVSGDGRSPVTIRLIGGDGVDRFEVAKENPNRHRLLLYDRSDEVNYFDGAARLRLAADPAVNRYDRREFKYNFSMPFFSLFYNVDQRTFTSLGWIFQKSGFRKSPYASRHQIIGGYSPERGSFAFSYRADWRQVFGKYGLTFSLVSLGPRNLANFFGTGNQTHFPEESRNGKNILYYRNRYDLVQADLRLQRYRNHTFSWSAGLAAQYYASSPAANKNRFLGLYSQLHPKENVFMNRLFAGLGGGLQVDTRPEALLTTGGLFFNLDVKALQQVHGETRAFGALRSEALLFTRLRKDSGLVLMNRIGGGLTTGDPLFYQMLVLGGDQNLRGYNTNRFTGRSMLYHNAELRLRLFRFTSYLFPGTVGLIGFNDVGRVWMPKEKAANWHDGYGGGLYITPAEVVLIRAVVAHSTETTQVYFNLVMGLK